VQRLREAFPFGLAPRFLLFDHDSKYGLEVPAAVRSLNVVPIRTSFESPWQNGVAESWIARGWGFSVPDGVLANDSVGQTERSRRLPFGGSRLGSKSPYLLMARLPACIAAEDNDRTVNLDLT
jgi:hypothetical protein